MRISDRPRLRSHIQPVQVQEDLRHVYLVDRLGLAEAHRLTLQEYHLVRCFDGRHSLAEIQVQATKHVVSEPVLLESLAQRLEEQLFLEGSRFEEVALAPVRRPRFIGCYDGDPDRLRHQLHGLFTCAQGPGTPRQPHPDGRLRAALLPHIDYPRGGTGYAWGFKEVFERTAASLFVIIGTSHHSRHRFTMTRKHFQTPLGIVHTDQDYIDRLVGHYGDGLFDDELQAHLPEHSIELEVVFLHYLYEKVRPIRIVPLVVGSFQDCVDCRLEPRVQSDIARMIESLRLTDAETKEDVCYIISGDLAHIGPKFGAREPVHTHQLQHSRRQDRALLARAEAVDLEGYFQVIAAEQDERNICGLPPTYVALEALRPSAGKLLHYDQYVHPRGHESVSHAAMAFYR